jgi:hypothetical protein
MKALLAAVMLLGCGGAEDAGAHCASDHSLFVGRLQDGGELVVDCPGGCHPGPLDAGLFCVGGQP